jgi:diaminopimelate epimerase
VDAEFLKVEGLGNDFVLIDRRADDEAVRNDRIDRLRAVAPRLCDRRFGVGADGILVLAPPRTQGHDATMLVINHDGSVPEMCGNGLRCVAMLVAADRDAHEVVIDTDAGPRRCRVEIAGAAQPRWELHGGVEVDMGPGVDVGPVQAAAWSRPLARVSMGNPHAIAFTEAAEDPETLARTIGPAIENDPVFPGGTNVEFCRVDEAELVLWVWERGCGITSACGTGACATAFAAAKQGRAPFDAPIVVRLPGGALRITVPRDPEAGITMNGPARVVFAGRTEIP